MSHDSNQHTNTVQDLQTGGIITVCLAPAIAGLGFLIHESTIMPLIGAASIMIFTGAGCLLAAAAMKD